MAEVSEEIKARAREIAKEQGHRDVDGIIVCSDGARLPVWRFYIEAAAITTSQRAGEKP